MQILIVDDEQMTRESLRKLISWQKLGVGVVTIASDGEDALEQAVKNPPDILLTDVRMPVIDGIALAQSFTELYPSCKILFLSGYSDKDYLMSAIKLQANAYIEKPIDPAEVEVAIDKAIQEILNERVNRQREIERLSMLREEFVRNLLAAKLIQAGQAAGQIGIECDGAYWCAAAAYAGIKGEAEALLSTLAEKNLPQLYFCQMDGFIHLLSSGECTRPEEALRRTAEAADIPLFIGMSNAYGGLNKAASAMSEALCAARDAYYFAQPLVAFSSVSSDGSALPSVMMPNPLGRPVEVEAVISLCCMQMTGTPGMTAATARDWLYHIASSLVIDAQQYRIPSDPLPSTPLHLWDWVNSFPTLATIARALTTAAYLLAAHADRRSHVNAAMRYIEENLGDHNLSQTAIAASLHLNPSYLCTVFREDAGETMVQYITRQRMARAKAVLCQRDATVHDVAVKVGYVDTAWFIKRFKQAFQMTPNEYKEKYSK